ncbi:MAG: HAMP domain-containing histidine kinase [Maribacter sp.]|nr:HAMP domain-containing histidine kinase [Maribacter sp.]
MKKRNLFILIFIISILGLAVVQYQYLRVGLNLAKVQFNKKIGLTSETIKSELSNMNELTFLIGNALKKDNSYFKTSVDSIKNASSRFLNDYITQRLVQNGIDSDFSYTLYTRDSTYYLKPPRSFENEEHLVTYPIALTGYLPDLLKERLILELRFRDLNTYFLSKMSGLTFPSILFLIGILITVIWVLRTYYWQRNLITTTNEFINNLTHELKTPVFSIGLATKILDEQVDSSQKPILAIIRQQVNKLTEHIDKVLELASLEGKKEVFNLEIIDFKPYLQKLCEEFKMLTSIENVKFTYDLAPGEYLIKAETFHLENAINNLLDNAKKYADQPQIHLETTINKDRLTIRVKDNGQGIDRKEKHHIFEKYYRVAQGDIHQVKGYGLGLSYVKKVVENLKGKVFIESELNKGTIVNLSIPLCHGR